MNMEAKSTKLFIDCEEAKHICDKSQYSESSWWERFRLNLRLIYCNITRAYVKQNRQLTDLITKKEVDCMDSEKKQDLKQAFEKELNK
ncbi:hypothetical protein [Pseudofulvibacter geojedonensis]|uniref:Glycine dehydrogenase n=1 Tax=Pseudofulvibacter geojedonensis TaxID=1123758 RepID=A0ABW3I4N5_9FLAO